MRVPTCLDVYMIAGVGHAYTVILLFRRILQQLLLSPE
jgi:hypothetical protein